jgi:heme/copper-type cytochrome/quinol oxidase subunit 2
VDSATRTWLCSCPSGWTGQNCGTTTSGNSGSSSSSSSNSTAIAVGIVVGFVVLIAIVLLILYKKNSGSQSYSPQTAGKPESSGSPSAGMDNPVFEPEGNFDEF